jgi:spermidine/putrescine transport system permease protein
VRSDRFKIRELHVLLFPPLFWLVVLFVVPLLMVLTYSVSYRETYGGVHLGFTLEHYRMVFDALYLKIFWRSFRIAAGSTLLTLLLAYPIAYFMAFASQRVKAAVMFLVILPFWTSFMVRMYSIITLLGDNGWVNGLLVAAGVVDEPLRLMNSPFAVHLGFVYWNLPFMVLPIFASLDRMNLSLIEASMDLGAGKARTFVNITLPHSLPGVFAGIVFTFVPSLGNFVIPEILGGADDIMIGNVITNAFTQSRNWPFGSALATVLIAVVMVFVVLYLRFAGSERAGIEATR